MGSSGSGAADCGVGSIVWVRRRNGSWWPGKILGPEELSASHLMSPRSGTPVKLLGREDASVDWYNLEKSKRVKAFRCGEFDDCIERAESSQGMPIKKREKYARREDAILHALKLEHQLLKGQGLLGVTSARRSSKPSVSLEKEPVTSSGSFGNDNAKFGNLKSLQVSKKLDTSRKDEIIGSPLYLHKVKEESLFSREEDIPAATPRMRGLLDLGMRISPSKGMLSSSVSPNGSEKDALDNTSEARPTHGPSMTLIQGNGVKSLNKKKRPHEGLSEDILVKKRDRRRPLVQVLQNSAILEFSDSLLPDRGTVSTSIPGVEQMGAVNHAKRSRYLYLPTKSGDSRDYKEIPSSHIEMPSSRFGEGSRFPHLGSFIEESASGFMDDVTLDSSDTDSSESDSDDDSSETEPDMDLEMAALSESDPYALGRPGALDKYGSLSSDELEESAHSGDTFHHPTPAAITVPRWKSKGKRNVRNLPRKRMETLDGKAFDFSKRTSHHNTSFLHNDVTDDSDWNGRDAGGLMVGSGNGGYSLSPRYPFKSQNMSRWEDSSALEDQAVGGGRYWEDPQEYFDSVYGHRGRSYLVEVDLQVQASYKKEPVPFVSLMSKLNGKAIIGHPIQIEKLDDGSTGTLLSTSNDFGNEAVFYDGNTALAPEWRTARRTVTRRPYASSSGTFHGDEDFTLSDKERRPAGHKTGMLRKNVLRAPPPMDRKLQKKLPKSSMSSGQKRRALSSFDVENNKHSSKSGVEGLMKDEAGGPTTVACIPVKLVFSRLLEKINRPPSKGVSNVLLT